MVDDPHPYELVKSHEIEEIMEEFLYEYNNSYFRQKVEFDTTNLTPDGILEPFLEAVPPPSGRPRSHLPRFLAEVTGWRQDPQECHH